MHESYLSQIRRKTLGKLVAFTRMIGTNANERVIIDSKLSLRYNLNPKYKELKKKCKDCACKAIMHIAKMNDFTEKCETFLKHSKKIFFLRKIVF